ncbi:hypothetical protein XaFJ1_GM002063 [Xanthomonas albilineans]|nr:hypothetical protein XaFJ1_GM002063 [Xanthomonas albilineans]
MEVLRARRALVAGLSLAAGVHPHLHLAFLCWFVLAGSRWCVFDLRAQRRRAEAFDVGL